MALTAIIEHGVKPGYDLVDETGLVILGTTFNGRRNKVEKRNPSTRQVSYVRAEDPLLTIALNGKPIPAADGALQGLCTLHPGNAATLANWTGTDACHGFSAADNRLIYMDDFTLSTTDEEEPTDEMNFTVYPGIAAPA